MSLFNRVLLPALLLGLTAAPCVRAETMAEQTLHGIVERQKMLLAQAAAAGDKLDRESLRTQLESLTHEYELLIQQSPDYAEVYADYGYLLRQLDMSRESMAMFLKADHLDPNLAVVKNELGNFLAEDGKPLEAADYFRAAIKLQPNEPLYSYQLGTLLYEGRDDFIKKGVCTSAALQQSAHEAFGRAAELAPNRIEFTYRYAQSFADLEPPDWEGAAQAWAALAAKAPSAIERQTMELQEAHARLKQGRLDEARALITLVIAPELERQKQILVAQLPESAKK